MNELTKVNKMIGRLARLRPGLEEGFQLILQDLRQQFHFSDVAKFNAARAEESYLAFEEWLNGIVVALPPYEGVTAMYFGMFDTDQGIGVYVIGSKTWNSENPDWASRHDWYMEDRILWLPMFKDISMALSKHSYVGYYLAVALLTTMIQEYTECSMISLLDDKRRRLHIACGFDDGELYNLGELHEDGIVPPGGLRRGLFR